MSKQTHYCRFGPYRLDMVDQLLLREGEVVSLTPKAVQTLLALVENRGRMMGKDELMKIVWPDTFVEEGGLARNISLLRKMLGDTSESGGYIETIPKRGYRFVAPVKEVHGEEDATSDSLQQEPPSASPGAPAPSRKRIWATVAVVAVVGLISGALIYSWYSGRAGTGIGTGGIESLVVLPLDNLSGDPSEDYFAAGMTEAVLTNLAKISALKVISYPSAKYVDLGKSPAELAKELRVDAALKGSVVRSNDRVRVNARLVRAGTGEQLWAEEYEQRLSDVLGLQSEVSTAIAQSIQVKMTPQEEARLVTVRSVVPEAYEAYARGRFYWNRRTGEGLQKGMGHFQQAIEADPGFAQAYSGLADAFALLGSVPYDALPPSEAMPRAKGLALKALELDDTLAEAHVSLAYVKLSFDWDFPGARKEFERAIELRPSYAMAHHWYGHYFLAAAELDRAVAEMEQAVELDPLSLINIVGLGWAHYYSREYDSAIAEYRRVLTMDTNFVMAHYAFGLALEKKGLYDEAIAEFQRAISLSGGTMGAVAALGHAYAKSGRTAEAGQQIGLLEGILKQGRYVPALYLAYIYAGLGENDRAFDWAKKACEERSDYMIYINVDPILDGIRSDPRFGDLLQCVSQAY